MVFLKHFESSVRMNVKQCGNMFGVWCRQLLTSTEVDGVEDLLYIIRNIYTGVSLRLISGAQCALTIQVRSS